MIPLLLLSHRTKTLGRTCASALACTADMQTHVANCVQTVRLVVGVAQFAVRCQNISLAPHVNVVSAPGAGGPGGESMEQLLAQVGAGHWVADAM